MSKMTLLFKKSLINLQSRARAIIQRTVHCPNAGITGQDKARSPELHPRLPNRRQKLKHWSIACGLTQEPRGWAGTGRGCIAHTLPQLCYSACPRMTPLEVYLSACLITIHGILLSSVMFLLNQCD